VGRFEEAEQALEAALSPRRDLADTAGESHVLRCLGLLRWHQDRYTDAFARHQQAKCLDLSAATSLARLRQRQDKRQDAHDLLAPVYDRFTEWFDTKDLQEASDCWHS
jgi:predicted ATPase